MLAHSDETAYGAELKIPCKCSYFSKLQFSHLQTHLKDNSFKRHFTEQRMFKATLRRNWYFFCDLRPQFQSLKPLNKYGQYGKYVQPYTCI